MILFRAITIPNCLVIFTIVFLSNDDIMNKTAPEKLKRKWAMAILMAVSELKLAAIKAVKVVPKFAPIINGKALMSLIFLVATNGTNKEVETELDWIADVINTPQPNDLTGF